MSAQWWSQPFAPEGSAAAEGIVKQLGQPKLDPLTVLVREAAQNSWDARASTSQTVSFTIALRRLGDSAEAWRSLLLPAPDDAAGVELAASLTPESIVLVVSDRGTVGLGGVLRAGKRDSGRPRSDFVQFLRNVGEPSDHAHGGGTYGFGKGIFYRLSRSGAILVDTHTSEPGPANRRLMGAALGGSWFQGDRRYTGRHWWGAVQADGIPDPLLDVEAAVVARSLGLPGFDDGATGTDIAILGADLGSLSIGDDESPRDVDDAAMFIASSILWNLWPKFVADEAGISMSFTIEIDGERFEVPHPESLPDFAPFLEALGQVRSAGGTEYKRTREPKHAGRLALALTAAKSPKPHPVVMAARPFEGPAHHVARMRSVELIVDYLPGSVHPHELMAYGGVFRASEEADAAFAAAEPPTHDDWVLTGLTGVALGVVRNSRAFVQSQVDAWLAPASQRGGSGTGLGRLASRLGTLITVAAPPIDPSLSSNETQLGDTRPGTETGSADSTRGQEASGRSPAVAGPRRGGSPRIAGAPRLQIIDGVPRLVATVIVPASPQARILTAEAFVVVEGGGRETTAPVGSAVPQVIEWHQVEPRRRVVAGHRTRVEAGEEGEWRLYATHVPDAVVRFAVAQEVLHGA